jgi:hypothetical protein
MFLLLNGLCDGENFMAFMHIGKDAIDTQDLLVQVAEGL